MVTTVIRNAMPLHLETTCLRGSGCCAPPQPRGYPASRRWRAAFAGCWVLAAFAALAAEPAAASAGAPTAAPCSIVLPQPRADVDGSWWSINLALADDLAAGLVQQGRRVLRLQVPADAPLAPLVQALLEQSDRHGCDRIVETSLYPEYPDQADGALLVARLRAYPVQREGTVSRIGAPVITLRQEYPDTARNRDRLTPAQLAREFAAEYARLAPP